jgi:hypothetical protein
MEQITVDEVIEAAESLFKNQGKREYADTIEL